MERSGDQNGPDRTDQPEHARPTGKRRGRQAPQRVGDNAHQCQALPGSANQRRRIACEAWRARRGVREAVPRRRWGHHPMIAASASLVRYALGRTRSGDPRPAPTSITSSGGTVAVQL